MKQITLILGLLLLFSSTKAQYHRSLVEHFTNTYCSLCPAGNANLHTVLDSVGEAVHHISYHPSVPYSQCSFYQANTSGNGAREQFYNVNFTPQAFLNGVRSGTGNNMLSIAQANQSILMNPDLDIRVNETDQGNNQVRIDVALDWITSFPSGDYRLFVAVVEKTVNFTAPNGETDHRNVFRTMLPNDQGELLVPPGAGQQQGFTYFLTIDPSWHAPEIYAIAFVQDVNTKEVFNAGTKFDAVPTAIENLSDPIDLYVFPNPAQEKVRLEWTDFPGKSAQVTLLDMQGRQVLPEETHTSHAEMNLVGLSKGMYLIRVEIEGYATHKKLSVR